MSYHEIDGIVYETDGHGRVIREIEPIGGVGNPISLRDRFAMIALDRMLWAVERANDGAIDLSTSQARYCYEWADAMMAAREVQE